MKRNRRRKRRRCSEHIDFPVAGLEHHGIGSIGWREIHGLKEGETQAFHIDKLSLSHGQSDFVVPRALPVSVGILCDVQCEIRIDDRGIRARARRPVFQFPILLGPIRPGHRRVNVDGRDIHAPGEVDRVGAVRGPQQGRFGSLGIDEAVGIPGGQLGGGVEAVVQLRRRTAIRALSAPRPLGAQQSRLTGISQIGRRGIVVCPIQRNTRRRDVVPIVSVTQTSRLSVGRRQQDDTGRRGDGSDFFEGSSNRYFHFWRDWAFMTSL